MWRPVVMPFAVTRATERGSTSRPCGPIWAESGGGRVDRTLEDDGRAVVQRMRQRRLRVHPFQAMLRQRELLDVVVKKTPTTGVYAARSGCEVSAALGARLGIEPAAISALDHVYERWDGRGIPDGRANGHGRGFAQADHAAAVVLRTDVHMDDDVADIADAG